MEYILFTISNSCVHFDPLRFNPVQWKSFAITEALINLFCLRIKPVGQCMFYFTKHIFFTINFCKIIIKLVYYYSNRTSKKQWNPNALILYFIVTARPRMSQMVIFSKIAAPVSYIMATWVQGISVQPSLQCRPGLKHEASLIISPLCITFSECCHFLSGKLCSHKAVHLALLMCV